MAVLLSPIGGVAAQFFDSNGSPLSGGLIYTYAAGTNIPQATYTSASGSIQHSNPIQLDAAGRVPSGEIWLTDGVSYKFVIKDANSVLIGTYDNIVGINSNFIAFTESQEIQTATAGQTVFTLTTMQYQPGTNSLTVYVDGVNQYGPGAQYAYVETDSSTITFNAGLHDGASVKFTTVQSQNSGVADASQITYEPPFTDSVTTNVEAKLSQYVSAIDFGAVGDGVTDDTAALQAGLDYIKTNNLTLDLVGYSYLISSPLVINNGDCGIANGTLIADAGFTADGTGSTAMLRLNTGLRISVVDVNFECNFVADGIDNESFGFANFYGGLEINESKDFGIRLQGNGDQRIANCIITQYQMDGSKRTGIGVWVQTADCKIQNSTIRYWEKCVVIEDSTNLITDCHFYNGNPAGMINPLTNSVNLEISGLGNTIANCYIDKGRIVLIGTNGLTNQFVGNRYLFNTTTPPHDSVFVFDALNTANSTWPVSVIHEANFGTTPVAQGTIPFVELTASGTGSWATSAQDMAADLQTLGSMFGNEGEKTQVIQPNRSRTVLFETSDQRVTHQLAGATYGVSHGMLASAESIANANGLKHRYSATGTLSTAILSVEGSRTGPGTSTGVLRLSDRRGDNTQGLSDTDLGYFNIALDGNSGTNPNALLFIQSVPGSATETEYLALQNTYLRPGPDNTMNLGGSSHRWAIVYAGTGTINTSDKREKQDIADLDEVEKRVAVAIKGLIKKFRFKDAVQQKGDDARIHIGVMAQDVKAAFEAEGLDAHKYGIFCADILEDGTERYGIRYDELLCFVIGAM